jgi:hypothetical protein
VSKKKKGAPKTASKGSRKRATKKRVGPPSPRWVNLTPLKKQLSAHIERLGRLEDPSGQIKETIGKLTETRTFLSSQCGDTMVLPTE